MPVRLSSRCTGSHVSRLPYLGFLEGLVVPSVDLGVLPSEIGCLPLVVLGVEGAASIASFRLWAPDSFFCCNCRLSIPALMASSATLTSDEVSFRASIPSEAGVEEWLGFPHEEVPQGLFLWFGPY